MSFGAISQRYLEPISQWVMVFGIVALCQPWIEFLHRYGVTIILVGLVGFLVFSKIRPSPDEGGGAAKNQPNTMAHG